jgi:hypothetical protein
MSNQNFQSMEAFDAETSYDQDQPQPTTSSSSEQQQPTSSSSSDEQHSASPGCRDEHQNQSCAASKEDEAPTGECLHPAAKTQSKGTTPSIDDQEEDIDSGVRDSNGNCDTPPPPKGKGKAPGPLPCARTAKGKGKAHGPPPPKGKGKGRLSPKPQDVNLAQTQSKATPKGPPLRLVARLLDGREFELHLRTSDVGLTVKQQINAELGVSVSRLRLVTEANLLGDLTSLDACGMNDGDAINVIILSPLQGSLTRSGLDVPIDVLELKMAMHGVLQSRGRLIESDPAFEVAAR